VKPAEPRLCAGCGVKRRAKSRSRYCYDCAPGGPFTPPPCRRCGTTENFFASGLCARCHLHGSQRVDACPDCHAWGATRTTKWVCWPCQNWRATYSTVAACVGCCTVVTLNTAGVCRLCRAHARQVRRTRPGLPLVAAIASGRQLFFANMHKKARGPKPLISPTSPPSPRLVYPVTHRQLVLFAMPHDLSGGRSRVGPPRDPVLAQILDGAVARFATDAEWDWRLTTKVRSGIRLLLGMQDTPGAPIARSELAVLADVQLPQHHVAAVLNAVGMLEDDRTPAIVSWFARETAGLPAPMTSELTVWFDVMVHGSTTPPRRRPRNPHTIMSNLRATVPALRRWAAAGHASLREITRADVLAALPAEATPRKLCGHGMRSIFGVLKSRKLIFANPAVRLAHTCESPVAPPTVDLDVVRAALNSPDPVRAAVVALVAYHGLRSHELRNLQLTDIRDRHLHIDGRVIPLADPVRRRIGAWLDHRAERWPTSTNPHLFIHFRSAGRAEPVGVRWVFLTASLPGGVQALRQDRILHEAIASGGDPRRLSDLFGLSIGHATRYTDIITEPVLDH
jgi:hypothetical protein